MHICPSIYSCLAAVRRRRRGDFKDRTKFLEWQWVDHFNDNSTTLFFIFCLDEDGFSDKICTVEGKCPELCKCAHGKFTSSFNFLLEILGQTYILIHEKLTN